MEAAEAARAWVDPQSVVPLGAGHIHDTYLVVAGGNRYVLQKVNDAVFQDTDLLQTQTQRVLAHWSQQQNFRVPHLEPTTGGEYHLHAEGVWRLWRYLEGTTVVDPLTEIAQARAAGHAFGAFQAQLASLSGPRLGNTIPGFLELSHYLRAFDAVADAAPRAERRLIDAHRHLADALGERNAYIHGDCKINNLLFDAEGEQVVAVIDFDTVMYGHWAWDLGDLVRSASFSQGRADVSLFAACLEGFAQRQAHATVEAAVLAPSYVTVMLGIRFLTDHLLGDRYFRVSRRGENLRRAREQFALLAELESHGPAFADAAREVLAARVAPD